MLTLTLPVLWQNSYPDRRCQMTLAQRYFSHRSNVIAMPHLIQRWFNRLAQQAMHITR